MVAYARNEERAVEHARDSLRGELPEELAWIACLSRPHLMQFAIELYSALARLNLSGDRTEVLELLDAWEATAELDADPEAAAEILRPREENDYVEWRASG